MKRNVKKHVSLLLAMLMLLTSVGFNVFAESTHVHTTDTNNPEYFKVVNPTCDEMGYTIYYCVACSTAENKVEASRGNPTPALGHVFDAGTFEKANEEATYYNKVLRCTRSYMTADGETTCQHSAVETENGNEVVYYLVTFANNRVVDSYKTDINGVKLIKEYKAEAETLKTYYVKSGTAVTYDGATPYIDKTEAFDRHRHIGWTENASLEIKEQTEYASTDFASLDSIEKNTVLYPVFGGVDVEHDVTFFGTNGQQITKAQAVKHGGSPVYRVNASPAGDLYPDPTKASDIQNYYTFTGWSTKSGQTSGIKTLDVEKTPIYARTNYYPAFAATPKRYTVQFLDYKGSLIQAFDNITFNTNLKTSDIVADAETGTTVSAALAVFNNKEYLAKPSNATYNYEWTGKWRIRYADGSLGGFVDLQNFKITQDDFYVAKDEDGNTIPLGGEHGEVKKVVTLVPEYDDRLVVYYVGVKMTIPAGEDQYYYLGDAAVRVFDYNNQLIASGKTDDKGEFICKLNYIEGRPYTVKITTSDSKYLGESKISGSFEKDPNGDSYVEAMVRNVCNVNMTRNPEYETHCSCIHHNALLQPIWVRILNLLNTFFNVKYECCYDMYSTIGPLLQYTKD